MLLEVMHIKASLYSMLVMYLQLSLYHQFQRKDCLNFGNPCALNSPVSLAVVKKSLDYFSQFIFIGLGLTVQTVDVLLREINLAAH